MNKTQKKRSEAAVFAAVGRLGGVVATAKKIGVTRQTVTRWHNGQSVISADNARALAEAASMAPEDFRPDLWGAA